MGYHRAGFDVTGVDIKPQTRYPFVFIQGDALEYVTEHGHEYDVIHASPPCQRYIRSGLVAKYRHPDSVPTTRRALEGHLFVLENVPGAPMRTDVMLCGSMFGLPLRRHRQFEFHRAFVVWMPPQPCDHRRPITGVYGNPHGSRGAWPSMLPSNLETWSQAMGIDWMSATELAQAIPPAYTEFIGRQLLAHLAGPALDQRGEM